MKPLPVLIVEDDASLREALTDTLELSGYAVLQAADGAAALELLERRTVGLVVSDVQMKPMDGEQLLREIKRRSPALAGAADDRLRRRSTRRSQRCAAAPATICSSRSSREAAGRGGGALDAARRAQAPDDADRARSGVAAAAGAGGARRRIRRHGPDHRRERHRQGSVRALHPRHSARAAGPFVAINCAAIPENLLEATLFGYEKGAFTGAPAAQAGKFEQAQGGTLLLDEISEMPAGAAGQAAARAAGARGRARRRQEADRARRARSRHLQPRPAGRGASGRFREDLYYRLNVFPLHIPPLRSRPLDIVPLAQRVLQRAAQGRALTLAASAEAGLTAYSWRGNIRELENVMQRAVILAPGGVIELEHLWLPGVSSGRRRGSTWRSGKNCRSRQHPSERRRAGQGLSERSQVPGAHAHPGNAGGGQRRAQSGRGASGNERADAALQACAVPAGGRGRQAGGALTAGQQRTAREWRGQWHGSCSLTHA